MSKTQFTVRYFSVQHAPWKTYIVVNCTLESGVQITITYKEKVATKHH